LAGEVLLTTASEKLIPFWQAEYQIALSEANLAEIHEFYRRNLGSAQEMPTEPLRHRFHTMWQRNWKREAK